MNKIAVIDMDSVAFSIGAGIKIEIGIDELGNPIYQKENNKLVYIDKTEEQLIESADFVMNGILSKSGCTEYIGFIKGKNTIQSKLKYNSDYKQNRPTTSPGWWQFVKEDLIRRYNIFTANNYEVDEFVVSFYKQTPDSFICAIDSDILGTEGTHYNWRKESWVTTTKEEEEFNFWSQMITGNHNNVKGLPGKGVKYVNKLIEDDAEGTPFPELILHEYIKYFTEEIGIDEFYKTYKSLIIKKDLDISKFKTKEICHV
jgi:hypothetical protein